MVTLPRHPRLIVTKSVPKSGARLSREDANTFFDEGIDFQSLSALLDNNFSEVRDYDREYVATKTRTKSGTKLITLIDALNYGAKSSSRLL